VTLRLYARAFVTVKRFYPLELTGYNAENLIMTFDDQLKRVFDAAVAEMAALSTAERDRVRDEAAERAREEGLKDGREQGLKDGREQGLKDGREQGRSEGRTEAEQESRAAIEAAIAGVRAETASEMTAFDRLLDAVRAIDRARSLTEVLDTLAGCAGREAARAAVLIVRDEKLEGWRFIGFDGITDEGRKVEISLKGNGLLAECVRGKRVVRESDNAHAQPVFAEAAPAASCVAAPVTLVDEVVAILYADQGPQTSGTTEEASQKSWPRVLEVLARHGSRSLEALTAMKAARAMAGRELLQLT
jgi:hypothetical protein